MCDSSKQRLESTAEQLVTCQSELSKLKSEHEKISKRAFKHEEKIKKYETAFDAELETRLGDVIKRSEENEENVRAI